MPNINTWLRALKSSDPERYQRLLSERSKKAVKTRRERSGTNRLAAPKNPVRVAAGKRAWATRQENYAREMTREAAATTRFAELDTTEISKMNIQQLRELARQGAEAVSIREKYVKQWYSRMGTPIAVPDTEFFRRENFEVSESSDIAELRHIVTMEQKYLARQNTEEQRKAQLDAFINRAAEKAGARMSQKGKLEYRKRFFKLYSKAKELYNGGQAESKGSPLYTEVAEILEGNPDVSEEEFIALMERNYAERQEAEEQRLRDEGGATTADFFGLSDDDII